MLNCEYQNWRDVVNGNDEKIGEVADNFHCTVDPEYLEIINNGDQNYNFLKIVTFGDLVFFWFACVFLVGCLVLFIIKFVRNKNVF